MILDNDGQLVWFRPLQNEDMDVMNFKVQTYRGETVLTWWEGYYTGHGQREYVIFDDSYHEIARFTAANGYNGDHHEFLISPQDTALITIYKAVPWDLSYIGGARHGVVWQGIVQELDIETGEVLFEWRSIDHVGLEETYVTPLQDGRPGIDYFHINSIDVDHDDNLLVSARETSAVYKIDRNSGEIIWRLGGKKSDFEMGPGTRFAFQHDARRLPDGTITIFDNGSLVFENGIPKAVEESRGIVLELDERKMKATLVREYTHPDKQYADAAGNMQVLPNGNVFVGWGRATGHLGVQRGRRAALRRQIAAQERVLPGLPLPVERSSERSARCCGRACLRRGGQGLRQLERCHGGSHLGGARRTAPRPTRVLGTGPPKRIRDGNGGPNLRSLRRRASQGPFGTGTRHLQGPQAGKLSGVVQLRLRDDLLPMSRQCPRPEDLLRPRTSPLVASTAHDSTS